MWQAFSMAVGASSQPLHNGSQNSSKDADSILSRSMEPSKAFKHHIVFSSKQAVLSTGSLPVCSLSETSDLKMSIMRLSFQVLV